MRFLKAFLLIACLSFIHSAIPAQDCKMKCPDNIVIKADRGMEGALVSFPPAASVAKGDCGDITYSRPNGSFFRLGSHSVIASSATGQKCSFTVTVTDNEPPTLTPITLSRTQIWPASNKMKKVAVYYDVSDKGDTVNTTLSVTSNATDGVKDWEIVNQHLLRLKSSRLADGSVRIYTITVTATDAAGNKTTRTTSIAVSRTMTAVPAVPAAK